MNFAFTLLDWQARAPGLNDSTDWQSWAKTPRAIDPEHPVGKCRHLPMMTARRLNSGSRFSVDCGLSLLQQHGGDAVVFTSRHGELERNLRILLALSQQESLSPTDFTMSVHNSAVGSLTIAARSSVVSTSIAAGVDSFQQGLLEVAALHQAGYRHVVLVDFDGIIPAFYDDKLPEQMPRYPYAVALLLAPGDDLTCSTSPLSQAIEPETPQSLQFLQAVLAQKKAFNIGGANVSWQWKARYE
ncbi:beta-ketoacyl synthase [Lonsdalea britannica]|uniref:beta-ketoacyl synthase chain length factor n=1 Tax=Lonsdalea britannica TaxID=1082704 RepID=UPI000A1D5F9E|nr:beta-ketoacyl synthase chain length factor [Lonsdalea britannica]OSN09615.1 beta-ketoacyl synthase [Lonsdalea britannica]